MSFISKKEREKTLKKLHNTNRGKKTYISISLILAILSLMLVVFIELLTLIKLPDSFKWFINWIDEGVWFDVDAHALTRYGLTMLILISIIIFMLLSSLIVLFKMKSQKWAFEKAVDLVSTPVAGESGKISKSAKRILKDRVK